MAHRQAHFPHVLPMALAGAVPAMGIGLLGLSVWITVPVCFLLGWLVPWLWLRRWRRRHPVITPEQYLDNLRSKAMWN